MPNWRGPKRWRLAWALHSLRGIREDGPAAQAADEAEARWARATDAWDAIKWTLARDPEDVASWALNESGTLRALTIEGARSIELPTVTVVYDFNLQHVTIREALFADAKAQRAGHA